MIHCLAVLELTPSHGQLVQTVLWCHHGMWMQRQSVAQLHLRHPLQTPDRRLPITLPSVLRGNLDVHSQESRETNPAYVVN